MELGAGLHEDELQAIAKNDPKYSETVARVHNATNDVDPNRFVEFSAFGRVKLGDGSQQFALTEEGLAKYAQIFNGIAQGYQRQQANGFVTSEDRIAELRSFGTIGQTRSADQLERLNSLADVISARAAVGQNILDREAVPNIFVHLMEDDPILTNAGVS